MDFRTLKVQNYRIALYMLSIRAPEPPFPPVDTFIFPLSPERITRQFTAMSEPYDTAGAPQYAGIQRTIDEYGATPFFYEIEGTTGFDLHMTDGFMHTGMQSIRRIYDMLMNYASLNQQQRLANNPNTYTLEFADFFTNEFYQVEPVGRQELRASERAPLLQYYRFRLAGVNPIHAPLLESGALDPIAVLMAMPGPSMVRTALALTTAVLSLY